MSFRAQLGLLGALVLAASGCEEPANIQRVTRDDRLQAKFETTRRIVGDIEQRAKAGGNVYADCRVVKMLFLEDLRRIGKKPAVRALRDRYARACRGATPY